MLSAVTRSFSFLLLAVFTSLAVAETKTIKLPCVIEDVAVGGGGRFVILYLKEQNQLAIFDAVAGEVTKTLSASDDAVTFAASMDKLVVSLGTKGVVQRYDLHTLEREIATTLPLEGSIINMVMGASSSGPLMVVCDERTQRSFGSVKFFDPINFRPHDIEIKESRGARIEKSSRIRAAANGQVFGTWRGDSSPSGLTTVLLAGDTADSFHSHTSVGYVVPNFDGSKICTAKGIKTNRPAMGGRDQATRNFVVPAIQGNYYMTVQELDEEQSKVGFHFFNDDAPFYTLDDVDLATSRSDESSSSKVKLTLDQRIILTPAFNKLISIPKSEDQLVVRDFVLKDVLKQSNVDYLIVSSQPPTGYVAGQAVDYQLVTLSKQGGIEYELSSGPEGMTISPAGRITWNPPANSQETHHVIVTVSDRSGQDAFHTFKLSAVSPGSLPRNPSVAASDVPPRQPAISPATPAQAKKSLMPAAGEQRTVKLPATVSEIQVGAAGRYLILHLKSLGKLAVFDVNASRIVKYISVNDANVLYAAGAEDLVVYQGDSQTISRWRLTDFEHELTVRCEAQLNTLAMGNASLGPIFTVAQGIQAGAHAFYDLKQLRPIPISVNGLTDPTIGSHVRVSANGSVVTHWRTGVSPTGLNSWVVSGDSAQAFNQHTSVGNILPSPDGQVLFTSRGMFTKELKLIGSLDPRGEKKFIPAIQGPFYFEASKTDDEQTQLSLHLLGDERPVLTLASHQASLHLPERGEQSSLPLDQRLFYVPDAKAMISVPESNDHLVVTRFDLEEALEQSPLDYLLITSRAPLAVTPGTKFDYQIDVKSKRGELKYDLSSGPDGMAISPTGRVTWPVPQQVVEPETNVVIAVSDGSGQEIFHTFTLGLVGPSRSAASATNIAGEMAPAASSNSPSELVGMSDVLVQMPSGTMLSIPDFDHRGTIVAKGTHIAVMGPDGTTIVSQHKLPHPIVAIAARKDYFAVVFKDQNTLELVDRKTWRSSKSIPLPKGHIVDLVAHPKKPICYVSIRHSFTEIPGARFVAIDEKTGKGRESEGFIGSRLAIDASGKYLLTGYDDSYQSGSSLLANPGRLHVIPSYGHINWLLRYQVDSDGWPEGDEIQTKATSSANGIRISPDGKRLAMVPKQNLCKFFNLKDFAEIPVTIQTQAAPNDLAFHPSLNIAAILQGPTGTPAIINPDTGEPVLDKLKLPSGGMKGTGQSLYFSADGRYLVTRTDTSGVDYLVRMELDLDKQELAQIGKYAIDPPAEVAAPTPAIPVPLRELEALQGGLGKKMNAKDIGRWFNQSVVVIKTDAGTGTGFIVGSKGHVLTCAHCVPGNGDIHVTYQGASGEITQRARRSLVDEQRDLALLEIPSRTPLRPIRLAAKQGVESGERVTIIANPGVGQTILSHTLTEGIVSNAAREMDGLSLIQASAAVNPGSSGAPMFDSNGLVIGLVVMKASIEGAGFAIPCDELTKFLVRASSIQGERGSIRRYWFDASGTRQLDAILINVNADSVQLKTSSGADVNIPVTRLSENDRWFVRVLAEAN